MIFFLAIPDGDSVRCSLTNYHSFLVLLFPSIFFKGENNLEGVLPWEVASLEYLQVLRLRKFMLPNHRTRAPILSVHDSPTRFSLPAGNYLTGSLPSQIGALKNLQHINLGMSVSICPRYARTTWCSNSRCDGYMSIIYSFE